MAGIEQLAADSDVIIIVDVMSFSTCVDIAVSRGAIVYPYQWRRDEATEAFARSIGGVVARPRKESASAYTLSPVSLMQIPAGTRLVLPSPNGSVLSLSTGQVPTLVGCLRNAAAVACTADSLGKRISVIPAGEKWGDGSLRFAIEDLIGAGVVIDNLHGNKSPEAEVAVGAYHKVRSGLAKALERCSSGKELIGLGFASDLELIAALNCSDRVQILKDGAYVSLSS